MVFPIGGCLAHPPQSLGSPSPQPPCLGGAGTIFPLGLVVFQASPILHFTSEKLVQCLQLLGLPWPCFPLGQLPSFQQVISRLEMKLCKHTGGTINFFSEAFSCFSLSRWGAKLLPSNPNVGLAEKLLSGAVGTKLPLLHSTSLPAAVFAFSLFLR